MRPSESCGYPLGLLLPNQIGGDHFHSCRHVSKWAKNRGSQSKLQSSYRIGISFADHIDAEPACKVRHCSGRRQLLVTIVSAVSQLQAFPIHNTGKKPFGAFKQRLRLDKETCHDKVPCDLQSCRPCSNSRKLAISGSSSWFDGTWQLFNKACISLLFPHAPKVRKPNLALAASNLSTVSKSSAASLFARTCGHPSPRPWKRAMWRR